MSWYRNMRFIIKVRYISIDQALFYIRMHMCVHINLKTTIEHHTLFPTPNLKRTTAMWAPFSMGMQSEDLPVA